MEHFDWASINQMILEGGTKCLIGLIAFAIGLWAIKLIIKLIKNTFSARHIDETLAPFLLTLISVTLKVLLFISIISYLGFNMTSFIAILGAVGLAIGMALSGTLQNFAGGVILIIMKPFKVGHFIEAQGFAGTVKEIQTFNTTLLTFDNKVITLPNGPLATSTLVNYSVEPTRRVDCSFGIGYNDDIEKARQVITEVALRNEKVIKEKGVFVGVTAHGDNAISLTTRVWAKGADFWEVFFYMMEEVKNEFDKQNISIPYPQRDVHIYNEK